MWRLFILKFSGRGFGRSRINPRRQLLYQRRHCFQAIGVLQNDFIEGVIVVLKMHQRRFQLGNPLFVQR